ncbi:MAG: SRPBCC family protein [Bacteroidia bacterium]|nr:SRPBCC family protein [Bacteroidia bacterium]
MKENSPQRGTILSASTFIQAPQEKVWQVVQEIGDIQSFHPLIKKSYRLNEKHGLGAERHCELKPMGVMDEQIISWKEGEGFTAKVIGGKMLPPCEYMLGDLSLKAEGRGTRVSFTFRYAMKFGLLGKIMNHLLIKPQFKAAPLKYVEGLKVYVEKN